MFKWIELLLSPVSVSLPLSGPQLNTAFLKMKKKRLITTYQSATRKKKVQETGKVQFRIK